MFYEILAHYRFLFYLEERNPELLLTALEMSFQHSLPQIGLPLKLTTGVLAVVELGEHLLVPAHVLCKT